MPANYLVTGSRNSNDQRGLSAIELAVVVAVMAILATLVASSVTGMNQSASEAALTTDRAEIQKAVDGWVGEQPASRYPVATPVVVGGNNAVVAGATPSANGLPAAGSGLYSRISFTDSFTNPEGLRKDFVPGFLQRLPKGVAEHPDGWGLDEKGTVKSLAPTTPLPAIPTSTPTATATPTSTPTLTTTPTATPTPTPTSTPAQTQLVWATRASMLASSVGHGGAVAGGKIYAIGGCNWDIASECHLDLVQEYDAAANSWTYRASMPTRRTYLAAAAVGSTIYAVGGGNTSGFVSTVEAYDVLGNTWTTKPSMPTGRELLGVAAGSNGKVYAIGGWDCNPCYRALAVVEEYDPSTNSWATKASMPTARSGLAVVAANNGKIYAIGGAGASGAALATVEEYDPNNNTWTTKASMPTARRRVGAAVAGNGRIYAVGGYNSSGNLSIVEEYDPATNTWATKTSMPTAREVPVVAVAGNGKLYAFGGYVSGYNGIATNEEATIQ